MISPESLQELRRAINQAYLADEQQIIKEFLAYLQDYDAVIITERAKQLVSAVRGNKGRQSIIEAFLHEYQLNSEEGIVLMGIAEALLRIPDTRTQDLFLQEKLSAADWRSHLQHSESFLVNISSSALLLTGLAEDYFKPSLTHKYQVLEQILSRLGMPVIRAAIKQAMQQLAYQFVIAESIEPAIASAAQQPAYRYSFDMLGEAAVTALDAERYYNAYLDAIKKLAVQHSRHKDIVARPGISIKLSALCPRYEPLQHHRAVKELQTKLLFLVKQARTANISVTVDAEESERLAMSLDIFADVFTHPDLQDWQGFGLAVQAYQKRAFSVIRWLAAIAEQQQKKIPLRLVKGAYWDTEIKKAQENGLSDYPVFTWKTATDISYLACAKFIMSQRNAFYPQFATHNAHTVAAIEQLGRQHPGYEFQRLHGMGEQLYTQLLKEDDWKIPCRVYAPVGNYQDLLPYLVRRLLENGANTSFINQVENPQFSIEEISRDPVASLQQEGGIESSQIKLPDNLYGEERKNSRGLNLADPECLAQLQQQLDHLADRHWQACPVIDGQVCSGREHPVINPYDNSLVVGSVVYSDQALIDKALKSASLAFNDWRRCPVAMRAGYLQKASDLLEKHRLELVSLCIREGGRTLKDALSEVREAVDFCRYYAKSAQDLFSQPLSLPGPTGEKNLLFHYGRGVFVCISPWNFPIAIFIGQITAALAAGNTVIAKPASLTPLTAMRCIQLLHQAGIPENVLQFLPCDSKTFSRYCLADSRLAGVALTGSTETANIINRQLAKQPMIIPLIAETGGQNVMIADSSAHAEQLVQDVVQSAFNSAGQRCSALRVLFIQQEIADRIIDMLIGAMQQLTIGNPIQYSTDIGPVISHDAANQLSQHIRKMQRHAKLQSPILLSNDCQKGSFFAPCLIELSKLSKLDREVFGPVLHVIRFRSTELDQVIEAVNKTGFGLTLGIHSRIDATIDRIQHQAKVGNIYVNRNMIGAVVGVQPFGGMGLSGTGPKAGGPAYLHRFAVEQTLTTNTAAIGGNASLMTRDLT